MGGEQPGLEIRQPGMDQYPEARFHEGERHQSPVGTFSAPSTQGDKFAYAAHADPTAFAQTQGPGQEHRKISVRRSTLLWVLALLFIIIAAAVGGGVGGSLAVQNAKTDCLASATAVAASSCSAPVQTSPIVVTSGGEVVTSFVPAATDFPGPINVEGSSTFSFSSYSHSWGPLPTKIAIPEKGDFSYTVPSNGERYNVQYEKDRPNSDMAWLLTATFELCVEACAASNYLLDTVRRDGMPCVGVAWNAQRTSGFEWEGMDFATNCWLKTNVTSSVDVNGLFWFATRQ